jgi:hypothetical protein
MQPFEADHIIPHSRGGPTALENLAFSCGCNSYKGVRISAHDPQSGRHAALFHPRRQAWARHFAWSADFTLIAGRTAAGRATVDALRLNRPELVNLRRALRVIGEHPPED